MEEVKNTMEQAAPGAARDAADETNAAPENTGKTFTQDEVNQIVQRRLAEERKRFKPLIDSSEDDVKSLLEREKEVTRREIELEAKERLQREGLPVDLMASFNLNSRGEFEDSYSHITSVFKPVLEIAVRDEINKRLRGELPKAARANIDVDPIRNAFLPPQK